LYADGVFELLGSDLVGYEMGKQSLASRFGGICPDKAVLFTVHNTVAALNATAGNHVTTQQSVYIVGA
jgi:hypothetical protein